jgi:type I restriction enzyme S subunit
MRDEALMRLTTLGPAIYAEMFGDWRVAQSRWPLVPLGSKLDFLTSGSRGWAEYYRDNGGRFLRIQNVKRDELDLSDLAFVEAPSTAEARRTRVKSGDVLLSITADLGRTAVVPADIGEAYINQHLAILRSSKVDSRFLSAALASPAGQADIMKKNREGVKAGLNFDDVRSIRIPDTPLAIQQAFSERMSEVDKLRSVYRADLDTLDALFVSLQHHAFRGELTSKDVERELAMAG